MQWLNEPPSWNDQSGRLQVITGPQTDFWRKTHNNAIRDNGHFYFQEVQGDFEAELKFSGLYQDLYDHAGLMLRVNEENWIKTGIELFDGAQHASAVVTRDFSDWSVVRLEGQPAALWLRVSRQAETVNIYYSLNGTDFLMLRRAYLVPSESLQVGPMCAAPRGNGFSVTFEDFTVRSI